MKIKMLSYLPIRIQYRLSNWLPGKIFNLLRNSDKYALSGFDELECIFVHIPKTGGVSINKALFGNLGGGHKTVTDYKDIYSPLIYQRYFSFTFVRNPYSRLVSAYTFLKKGGLTKWDHKWSQENLSKYNCFKDFVMEWLNSENIWSQKHFKPQYHYVCEDGVPQVNYIGRFEQIQQDFKEICESIGIEIILAHHNSTVRKRNYTDFYDKEIMEKVVNVYKDDFQIFGYDIDDLES